jgi:hypothetical protein
MIYRVTQYRRKFLPKNFGDIGHSFCTGGLYRGIFFAKKFRRYWARPLYMRICDDEKIMFILLKCLIENRKKMQFEKTKISKNQIQQSFAKFTIF